MDEPPAHKSPITVWILAIAAALLLYVFVFPWVFFGWFYFAGSTPDWLYTLRDSWITVCFDTGLKSFFEPYWMWCNDVCGAWYRWMYPS